MRPTCLQILILRKPKSSHDCLKMSKISAGVLVFRRKAQSLEVLLLHIGGPLWEKKDCWTIPKGELDSGETEIDAARREFQEEVGCPVPEGKLIDLGQIRQSSAKTNHIWAVEGEVDIDQFVCNEFTMEWPPHSGKIMSYPECDRAEWFDLETAQHKLLQPQREFIRLLDQKVANI